MVKLAIDVMGGDYAPEITIDGAMKAIEVTSDLELFLFGDEDFVNKRLVPNDRIHVIGTSGVIDMGEKDPIGEIRRNKETSLVKAFTAVKNKEVDGVVTAGPTQAVIVAAHIIIKRIKGMKRVALCPNVPSFKDGGAIILDVGANTTIQPEYILQYAEYANIYCQQVKKINSPKCYLLNIGTEPGKGRELEQITYKLLENSNINFCGNLEPKELLTSDADIIITDGFSGNIAMKSFEGTAKAFGKALKEEIKSSIWGKIGYLFMKKNLSRFSNRFSAEKIGGATLFGVDGVVIKAHGSSSSEAFKNAILLAKNVVEGKVVEKMKIYLEENPLERSVSDVE